MLQITNWFRHGKSIFLNEWIPLLGGGTWYYSGHYIPWRCPGSNYARTIPGKIAILGHTNAYLATDHDTHSYDGSFHSWELCCWPRKSPYESTSWHRCCTLCPGHCPGIRRLVSPSMGEEG